MPNRIVRDGILRSRRVNALSEQAELFYRRLMSVVDDYGRYDADPSLLRSSLYPLRINRVSDADILSWLDECMAGDEPLVLVYEVKHVRYVMITGFRQRLRAMTAHYPEPPAEQTTDKPEPPDQQATDRRPPDDGQPTDTRRLESNRSRSRNESESESESEAKTPELISFPQAASSPSTEGWEELIDAGIKAGMSLDPSPTSYLCQHVWRYRDFGNRRNCIQGILERIDCGQYSREEPQFVPTLRKYIETDLWRETLRPRQRSAPLTRKAIARAEFERRTMEDLADAQRA